MDNSILSALTLGKPTLFPAMTIKQFSQLLKQLAQAKKTLSS